ncbi:MAG: hypothetical protein NVSMB55_18800 [Mycobacteriales bacterium]
MRRYAVAGLALVFLTAACGLKPAAKDALSQGGNAGTTANGGVAGGDTSLGTNGGGAGGTGTGTGGTGGTALGSSGGSTGGSTGGSVSGTSGGGTTSGGGGTSSGGGTRAGGATGGGSGAAAQSGPGNATGVTKDVLRIGIHAPITGAAPLPADSFRRGAEKFFSDPAHKVFGRTVQVEFLDDKYKPSSARQACENMAAQDFLVVGAAGTDQIQACATDQVLRRSNTPYLSAGVTTNGLTGLPNYFALSLTYQQQATAVMKLAKANNVPLDKVALVLTETPNFDDATAAATTAVKAAGGNVIATIRTPKSDSQSDGVNTASQLRSSGATTVYFLTAPLYWINTVAAASSQAYNPTYIGPGVSMGENQVAGAVCGAAPTTKAFYLSPYPGFDKAQASQGSDDIEFSVYGLSEAIFQALQATKGNLTREAFIAAMPNATLPGGVYNPARFNGGHFGGTAAHALSLNCTKKNAWLSTSPDPISP